MRMRTINEAMEEIRLSDPKTSITKTALRRLIVTGCIPSVKVGCKYLVAMEHIETYFQSQLCEEAQQYDSVPKVK